jgi:hypothetical protein
LVPLVALSHHLPRAQQARVKRRKVETEHPITKNREQATAQTQGVWTGDPTVATAVKTQTPTIDVTTIASQNGLEEKEANTKILKMGSSRTHHDLDSDEILIQEQSYPSHGFAKRES